jgi:hypothetical protein
MPERHDDLVLALRDLGERLGLPAADPVASAVDRIRTATTSTTSPASTTFSTRDRALQRAIPRTKAPPRWLVAAAIAAVVAIAGVLAAPGSRHAVADWLGIGSVRVTYTGELPDNTGNAYDLGSPVSVADAADRATWPLAAPSGIGDPDGAFVGRPARSVTLVWAASAELPEVGESGIGLLLGAIPGVTDAGAVTKQATAGTTVELVRVGDSPAYWIAGEPHRLVVTDPDGLTVTDATRLAGNTLLWTDGDVTYRLESSLDRDQVVDLASDMRPLE